MANTGNNFSMTIDELVDFVNMELTMSGALPCILQPIEIKRIIMDRCLNMFYNLSPKSKEKAYWYIPKTSLTYDAATNYSYIYLPDEITAVTWVYAVADRHLFEVGINIPNQSINLGITNQPFVSSYMTTVGELATYKVVIDGFADVLNQMTKSTYKYDYNKTSKRLNVLTGVDKSLMLEVWCKIESEALFADPYFQRYVVANAKIQLGTLLTFADVPLPGNVKLNGDAIKTDGNEMLTKVEEQLKKQTVPAFFRMVKR